MAHSLIPMVVILYDLLALVMRYQIIGHGAPLLSCSGDFAIVQKVA